MLCCLQACVLAPSAKAEKKVRSILEGLSDSTHRQVAYNVYATGLKLMDLVILDIAKTDLRTVTWLMDSRSPFFSLAFCDGYKENMQSLRKPSNFIILKIKLLKMMYRVLCLNLLLSPLVNGHTCSCRTFHILLAVHTGRLMMM